MANDRGKTVAITGMSGLIGTALAELAAQRGWTVIPMKRDRAADGIYWSVEDKEIDAEALEEVDAVVHLAGEPLHSGRWTEDKKKAIVESRVQGTTLIAETIASLDTPPEVLITASGVNFYGHTGDTWVDEESEHGEGFLADVCRKWEEASRPADQVCRVVNCRMGVVLSKSGGALPKMLTPFRLGVGGKLGKGDQYMSWVALRDVVRAMLFILDYEGLRGSVNVTAPTPVTNKEFTLALGAALGRPTLLPVPGPMLKLALGAELADEILLNGQRVRPKRLLEAGFEFEYETVDTALEDEVG